jgi:hypothetical protein
MFCTVWYLQLGLQGCFVNDHSTALNDFHLQRFDLQMSMCSSFGKEHIVHASAKKSLGEALPNQLTRWISQGGCVNDRERACRARPRLYARAYARKHADLLPKLVPLGVKNSLVGLRHLLLLEGVRAKEQVSAREGGCRVIGRGGINEAHDLLWAYYVLYDDELF